MKRARRRARPRRRCAYPWPDSAAVPCMRSIHVVLLALLLPASAVAADTHSIDARYEACIAAEPTTVGTMSCIRQAGVEWDAAMNASYAALLAILTPAEQDTLRVAQRHWLAFRDAEFARIDAMYADEEGSMWVAPHERDKMDIARTRALQLANAYEIEHDACAWATDGADHCPGD